MLKSTEYTIDTDNEPQIYRVSTNLTDITLFPVVHMEILLSALEVETQ